jgi:hypothetical protein
MVNRCNAHSATGAPCSAQPVRDDGYCYWHSPATAGERVEARRRGGVNRSNKARAKKELPAGVMTNDELRGLVGLTIKGVLGGRVEPGVGNAVAALARAYVTVTEAGAVEAMQAQVDELRALIAARGSA